MTIVDDVKAIFELMPHQIGHDAAKGMDSVIQFELSGEGSSKFYVEIKNGTAETREGVHPSPNMTMSMSAQDYVDLIMGKLNGEMAFMSGKLKIAGDMGLAIKMQNLFRRSDGGLTASASDPLTGNSPAHDHPPFETADKKKP